jgi:hypothetical protein
MQEEISTAVSYKMMWQSMQAYQSPRIPDHMHSGLKKFPEYNNFLKQIIPRGMFQ